MPGEDGFAASLKAAQKAWKESEDRWERETREKVSRTDTDVLLWQTRETFSAVLRHMEEGGTYRYLIYERLGFGLESYAILLNEGMGVSNWISSIPVMKGKRILFQNLYLTGIL